MMMQAGGLSRSEPAVRARPSISESRSGPGGPCIRVYPFYGQTPCSRGLAQAAGAAAGLAAQAQDKSHGNGSPFRPWGRPPPGGAGQCHTQACWQLDLNLVVDSEPGSLAPASSRGTASGNPSPRC